jgi:hypothetical protein
MALLVSAMQFAPVRADESGFQLQHNPFKHPDITQSPAKTGASETASAETEQAQLELRATLTYGRHSLANVAGKIIAIGEEIEGFRLLEVDEGSALFVKNGTRVNISVIDEAEDGQND